MKFKAKFVSGLFVILFVGISVAQSSYIKIGDIEGEATDRGHKDWINIESFSQAMEEQMAATGATRRRSAISFQDIVITKKLDKSSPKLMEACAKGQIIPSAEMVMVAKDGKTYYKVTLEKVTISSIRSNSNCDPNCVVIEEVSLNFSKITWEYTTSTGEKVSSTYNVQTGN